ncbi:MAG: ComEC/Rec2 family competence protein [Trueperaceae bacterium]|nr:ComEC/Rec2 family competence protein [Trueperaceae bacterium]
MTHAATPEPAPPFVPWPVPAALGVAAGIAGHAAGGPAAVATATVLALAGALAGLRPPPGPARRAAVRAALVLAVALPLGAVRHAAREARPAPLAPLAGDVVELAGRSDGRFLDVAGTSARVVLRPVGAVPRGTVRVRGRLAATQGADNPGGFDARAWARRRGAHHVLFVDAVPMAVPPTGLRARLRAALVAGGGGERGTLLRALVLGEREEAGPLRTRFAEAGLAHVLALSGLHLGILAGALGALLAPLGPARGVGVAVAAAAFAAWIGPTPSLVRAAAMTGAAGLLAARGVGRASPFTTLALAALLTLVARPDWLFDLAFVLSYLALLGILGIGAPLAERAADRFGPRHPATWTLGGLAVGTSAWAAGLPWVLGAFGEAALAGPLVNLVAVPLTTLLLPAGAPAALVGALVPPVAPFVGAIPDLGAGALLAVADLAARGPRLTGGTLGAGDAVRWGLLAVAAALAVRGRLQLRTLTAVASGVAVASLVASAWGAPAAARPALWVLDVGQGDALLLRVPGEGAVLIDGGGTPYGDFDVGAEVVVPALRALGVHRLRAVVATHADADHAEGLASVVRALPVGTLAYGHPAPDRPIWRHLAEVARAEGVPTRELRRGMRLALGDVTLHVLHPTPRPSGDANRDSVVLRIDWRDRAWALLAGDVPTAVEVDLAVPRTPLLVAPHHGSSHSTGTALLRAAAPDVVAISAGGDRYAHPAPDVLRRIADAGAEVRRTDREGALRFEPAW